jgi:hypothetical protein
MVARARRVARGSLRFDVGEIGGPASTSQRRSAVLFGQHLLMLCAGGTCGSGKEAALARSEKIDIFVFPPTTEALNADEMSSARNAAKANRNRVP